MSRLYDKQLRDLYEVLDETQVEFVRKIVLKSIQRAVKNGILTDEEYDSIKDLWERKKDD